MRKETFLSLYRARAQVRLELGLKEDEAQWLVLEEESGRPLLDSSQVDSEASSFKDGMISMTFMALDPVDLRINGRYIVRQQLSTREYYCMCFSIRQKRSEKDGVVSYAGAVGFQTIDSSGAGSETDLRDFLEKAVESVNAEVEGCNASLVDVRDDAPPSQDLAACPPGTVWVGYSGNLKHSLIGRNATLCGLVDPFMCCTQAPASKSGLTCPDCQARLWMVEADRVIEQAAAEQVAQ